MKRNRYIILLTAAFIAILTAAIFLPMEISLFMIPLTLVAAVLLIMHKNRVYHSRVEDVRKKLNNLKSEGLYIDDQIDDSDDVFYTAMLTILKDLERTLFKLVEKNIQLLSLKEIGRNIVSSLNEKKLVDSVFDYLVHGVGYREVAFILTRRNTGTFQAIVSIEKDNRVIRRTVSFDLNDIDGAILGSLKTGKSFMIKDVEMHPMGKIDEKTLFPNSTMTSYICVPLMKSSEKNICRTSKNCFFNSHRNNNTEESRTHFLEGNECLGCSDIPLLGALVVTDGFRATPLTNIDQVTLETVGSLVSSNIENWILYQELRQSEKFREKVFEGMIHGLIVTDLEGSVTFVNRSTESMAQRPQEELEGTNVFDLVVDKDGVSAKNAFFNRLYGEGPVSFYEAYLKSADGYHVPIRLTVSKFPGEHDEIKGAILTLVDLSDIKKMEEEIRHLDRLAALGRFTSAIAHEIRNPLTGIGAGIQYLKRSSDFNDEQDKSIESILSEVNRLNRIITDLFKVAKPRGLLYQEANISELVERGYNSIKDIFAERDVEFVNRVDLDLPSVDLDPDQITQVIINLLKNAAEAVEEGGKVEAAARICDGNIRGENIKERQEIIQIDISDNGIGFDEEIGGQVFEPFFSKKAGGTGLGLYISHSIIQHHYGRIDINSEPGKGTTFTICLPVRKHGR